MAAEISFEDGQALVIKACLAEVVTLRVVGLGTLPTGSRLLVRCKKDWRDATVIAVREDKTTLSVGSPSGRTYRIRKPNETLLTYDGEIPVLGEGEWRPAFARYDCRW